jgi:predicted nuclease of predicted toxin-antitoxin system
MKVLVDVNLAPAWVELLRSQGHDAIHWSQIGRLNAPDHEIMAWARERGWIVFTHDLDFGAMLAVSGDEGPSVLQVRARSVLPSRIGALVLRLLQEEAAALEAGALIVADESRHRVRRLPIRRLDDA